MTEQKAIAERLRSLNACTLGCDGRCKECPDDVGREAAALIDEMEKALADARGFVIHSPQPVGDLPDLLARARGEKG